MRASYAGGLILTVLPCCIGGCTNRLWMQQGAGQAEVSPEPTDRATANDHATARGQGYTQATRYEGELWFLSGQIGSGADAGEQTHAVMRKIGAILESRGLKVENILQVTVYLADINDLQSMESAYGTYFRCTPPARTVVAVDTSPRGALVQITATAGSGPGLCSGKL